MGGRYENGKDGIASLLSPGYLVLTWGDGLALIELHESHLKKSLQKWDSMSRSSKRRWLLGEFSGERPSYSRFVPDSPWNTETLKAHPSPPT